MHLDWFKFYDRIWVVDFEYHTGETGADAPIPVCVVGKDILSGNTIRRWLWETDTPCPFSLGPRDLYITFYAPAEATCHHALNWPHPQRVIDLQAEFRWVVNGMRRIRTDREKQLLKTNERASLLAAMLAFGLDVDVAQVTRKDEMRDLAIRGGPFTAQEQSDLLEYNADDVLCTEKVFERVAPSIELAPALFRGRYSWHLGQVERCGVPVDGALVRRLKHHWDEIIRLLIESHKERLDVIGVADIDQAKLSRWLEQEGLLEDWPRTSTELLSTNNKILDDWAKYSEPVLDLKNFLYAVRRTRLFKDLPIGSDNRNRFGQMPFVSATSRNQPSSKYNIYGGATWVRSVMQPVENHSLVYADFSGQEYGIAAVFSNDKLMQQDYFEADPYLGFGKRVGLVPQDATKQSHGETRDKLKVACGLGVLYGAQAPTVARAGDMSIEQARIVLNRHKETYCDFWAWRHNVIQTADLHREMWTPLRWRWAVDDDATAQSISNFYMQSAGADMLRVAACLALESGLEVVTLVHDAILIHCPTERLEESTQCLIECMREASAQVLGGPRLKVGIDKCVSWPEHYSDPRGAKMWSQIMGLLEQVEQSTSTEQFSHC